MSKKIILEVAGWCEVDLDRLLFVHDDGTQITGRQYLDLDESEKDQYIPTSVTKIFDTSYAGEWQQINIFEE
jgi:hypothetical protein